MKDFFQGTLNCDYFIYFKILYIYIFSLIQDNYNDEAVSTEQGTIKLAVRALLEVVQSGQKNIELVVLKNNEKMKMLDPASLEEMVNVIEAEKEALEKEKNKQKDKQ